MKQRRNVHIQVPMEWLFDGGFLLAPLIVFVLLSWARVI